MENFQFINLPDTPEFSKIINKGFEYISNQQFESIGQGLLIAYLFQSLSLSEYQYGLQYLRSLSLLTMPNQYTNLKTSILNLEKNFDLNQNLSQLFSPKILSEIEELGQELVDETNYLTMQVSLRKLSKKLNMHIVTFINQECIDFNYFLLPRPIIIGISIDNKKKYSLYSTQQQLLINTEIKQQCVDELIKATCDILEKHNIKLFFGFELNKLLGAVDGEVQQNVLKLSKNSQIINFSSAPILKNTDFRKEKKVNNLKPGYELPNSLEKTNHFLKEFVSDHPRKTVVFPNQIGYITINSKADYSIHSDFNIDSESESDIASVFSSAPDSKCFICKQEAIKFSVIGHPCLLCQQCTFESFLKKACEGCSHKYTPNELELMDPYFN